MAQDPARVAHQREKLARLELRRSKLTDDEDKDLREVFPIIVRATHQKAWNQLRLRALEEQEAEEILQESYAALYNDLKASGFPENLPGKLHEFVKHRLLHWLRDRKRNIVSVGFPSSGSEKPRSSRPGVDSATGRRAEAQRLLDELPQNFREVVDLVILYGFTAEEAAQVLGIPEGTVKTWLREAKKQMLLHARRMTPSSDR